MSSIGNRDVFAKNLTFYLERADKSQREMAEIVGVSPSTFNDWTKGRKYPRIDKIEFLANYFGIKKSDLIEEKKDSPTEVQLSEGEKMLLDLFKRVPEDQQQLVLQMIRAALGSRE
jgi:transcriptional regulator with XRE-family HTH domain